MMNVDYLAEEFPSLIRRRPGMYMGNVNSTGIRNLIYSMVYHQIEAGAFHNSPIHIHFTFEPDNFISISFHAQAPIPLIMPLPQQPWESHEEGLNWLTLLAVTEHFQLEIADQTIQLLDGVIQHQDPVEVPSSANHFRLRFNFSSLIFPNLQLDYFFLMEKWRELALLFPNTTLQFEDKHSELPQLNTFHHPEGVFTLLTEIENRAAYPVRWRFELQSREGEFPFSVGIICKRHYLMSEVPPRTASFINDVRNWDEGSHISSLRKGVMAAIEKYVQHHKLKIHIPKQKIFFELLCIVCQIKVKQPIWWGPTRERLDMPLVGNEIKKQVKKAFFEFLESDPERAKIVLQF